MPALPPVAVPPLVPPDPPLPPVAVPPGPVVLVVVAPPEPVVVVVVDALEEPPAPPLVVVLLVLVVVLAVPCRVPAVPLPLVAPMTDESSPLHEVQTRGPANKPTQSQ